MGQVVTEISSMKVDGEVYHVFIVTFLSDLLNKPRKL